MRPGDTRASFSLFEKRVMRRLWAAKWSCGAIATTLGRPRCSVYNWLVTHPKNPTAGELW